MPEEDFARPPAAAFVTVSDPEQARLLTDPLSLRFFEPFLAREKSASQAAAELGVRLDTLLYRLRVLERAGLVRVVRARKRAGRPIKLYRSSADAYLIPFEATPFAELEERIRHSLRRDEERVVRALARMLRASEHVGLRLYRGGDGEVWQESAGERLRRDWREVAAGGPLEPPIGDAMSGEMRLTDAEAEALLRELYRLFERYHGPREAGRRYLLQFTLLPVAEEA